MNTATNDNKPKVKPLHGKNFPSEERMAKGDLKRYTPRGAKYETAADLERLRIDKLLARGTITDEQRDNGLRLIAYHMAAFPSQKTVLARMMECVRFSNYVEAALLGNISAKDKYFMVSNRMAHYAPRMWQIVNGLCIKDQTVEDLLRPWFHENEWKKVVRDCFDLLGDVLMETRDRVKYLEETLAGGNEKC